MKLTQGARNVDVISSAQFDRKLAVAMTQTPTIMRTLFNPEEISTMARSQVEGLLKAVVMLQDSEV